MAVGAVLPAEGGIVYREVPTEYSAQGYRYTVVSGRTVLVEPQTGASFRSSTERAPGRGERGFHVGVAGPKAPATIGRPVVRRATPSGPKATIPPQPV